MDVSDYSDLKDSPGSAHSSRRRLRLFNWLVGLGSISTLGLLGYTLWQMALL